MKKSVESLTNSIREFVLQNPDKLNLPTNVTNVKLKFLGRGESNISILVTVNNRNPVVFRISQLYEDKIQKEYKTLSKIPSNIGPRPIHLNTDKKNIPFPFLVESFIAGESVLNWNENSLAKLARSLATLHNKTRSKRLKTISFVTLLQRDNNHFLKNYPELNNNKEIKVALKSTIKYLSSRESLLDDVRQLSIVHGDLNTDNIKEDNDKGIRFIDWELAHYNDPAREFSTFYYDDMKYLNWRIHLKSTLKDYFLSKYINESGIRDGDFKERVLAWQIVDKAGAFIFCSWKSLVARDAKTRIKFSKTANRLRSSLKRMTI